MAKEKKYESQMYEIAPGIYRGHAPKNQTPEEKAKQAEKDKHTVGIAKAAIANLKRNTKGK